MADLLDRPFSPTPRRRREARQAGRVARSTDLIAACCLLSGAALLMHGRGWERLIEINRSMLSQSLSISPLAADELAAWPGLVWSLAGPVLLGLLAVAAVAGVAQVGFLVTFKPLEPQVARLSPAENIKQIVGPHARIRLGMTWLKLIAVSIVAAVTLGQLWLGLVGSAAIAAEHLAAAVGGLIWTLAWRTGLVLPILGGVDYLWQRRQHERDLSMTRQQWQEEMRLMQGDPLTRQRQARVARQLAAQRVHHVIPQAHVVVTADGDLAIALRYDPRTMEVPVVVAKTDRLLAAQVRTLAAAHGVPVVQRDELANQLDKQAVVGRAVPQRLLADVAQVLAYAGQVRRGDKP